MKKKFWKIIVAVITIAAIGLTGCGKGSSDANGNSDQGSRSEDKGNSGKEVVKVVVPGISEETTIDPISGIEAKGLKDFESFLEEQIPDYDIELVSIPWDGWIQKIETLVSSGEVDVGFYTNQEAVPDWYMDLTEYLSKDEDVNLDNIKDIFSEPAAFYLNYKSFKYPEETGNIYGIPMTMASNIVVYDKQLFEDWGVDKPTEDMSFSELIDLSEQMTGKNPKTEATNYGGYLNATWMEWFAVSYDAIKDYSSETMLIGEMNTDDYVEYIKNSPEVLNYFEDMLRLVDACPEGVATNSGSEKFFTEDNDIAINFDTNSVIGNYMKYVYADDQAVTDRFIPLMIPTGDHGVEGFPEFFRFAITKTAKNPDAAWDVIKKMTTTPEIIDFYLTNYAQEKLTALADSTGIKIMDYELNQKRMEYQANALFITDDYWYWRTPLQSVNNEILSKQLTAEEAREAFYTGVNDWVTNIKSQLGQ
ncbi:MAG TPA: extracellular solute-binding protein [Candidatus Merdenecus merdavium]|nr:extracellular solute-binding protein [Candidatus Merdenecus merdavium]